MVKYTLFAFYKADDGPTRDFRRSGLTPAGVGHAVRWALGYGYDTVLIELAEPVREPRPAIHGVTHHVCSDPHCPGGCSP